MRKPASRAEGERPRAAVAVEEIRRGAAVPLDSPHYVPRRADRELRAAIDAGESIVLVQGPRQTGKSSLLARGRRHAEMGGACVVSVDLGALPETDLASADALFRTLADGLARTLGLDADPAEAWIERLCANVNLERYLRREALPALDAPVVWALDGVDRLLGREFSSEVFGLFRSLHNSRALDPAGPWSRLTLILAYSAEAHLFIQDPNRSPFNVGARVALGDFTPAEAAELDRRFGSPLGSPGRVRKLCELVGGHPWLLGRALERIAREGIALETFLAEADRFDGPFGAHLRDLNQTIARDPASAAAFHGLLRDGTAPPVEVFLRLRSAGILAGESASAARFRCPLYGRCLGR